MGISKDIVRAVDVLFDEEVDFLSALVRFPSKRGHEQMAQKFMATQYAAMGYEVDEWQINIDEIKHLKGFSPVLKPYEDARNVVGSHRSRSQKGRSLILNGHIDVVPEGPEAFWSHPPFEPIIKGDWLYGRGGGDMKAGLASNLFALKALRALGYQPAADVFLQSVVEEECTGNGALACLARGYRADAAFIPEPFDETLVNAQVGVLWFQIHLQGLPTHVAYAGDGANAIEAAYPIFAALHDMEHKWNANENRHHAYLGHDHALNLNIGKISGGDWTSSVPAWCVVDARMGVFPGQNLDDAKAEIEKTIFEAASEIKFLANNPPKVIYHGFQAEGYALMDDFSETARTAIDTLGAAHQSVHEKAMPQMAITATTDARFFGLYADTPALVYGPKAEAIHGFDERVNLESVRRLTQTTAAFIANWCGLEDFE